jgi:hypothetical protein
MGIERTMLNYQIGDIRMFYENDIRFLSNLLLFKIKEEFELFRVCYNLSLF